MTMVTFLGIFIYMNYNHFGSVDVGILIEMAMQALSLFHIFATNDYQQDKIKNLMQEKLASQTEVWHLKMNLLPVGVCTFSKSSLLSTY